MPLQGRARADGSTWTYAQMYEWMGHTARQKIFTFLDAVLNDQSQQLEVFAFDLDEPDICARLLTLAESGRVQVILDNSASHHDPAGSQFEDQFANAFAARAKDNAELLRGHMGNYAHDKVFIARTGEKPSRVLTGSTNFSVSGLYVNSNHVLVYDDEDIASEYHQVFQTVWKGEAKRENFVDSPLSKVRCEARSPVPATTITFAPHEHGDAEKILQDVALRIGQEQARDGSVFFAMMELDHGNSPVWDKLKALHDSPALMSFGISDSDGTTSLYDPGRPGGVIVTGQPGRTVLPSPFDQVHGIGSSHQIHHKFVVCGFNTDDAVVYCGSSNFATGGEGRNGDNLLEIRDRDIATVFAIEALQLVDHFQFLDRMKAKSKKDSLGEIPASKDAAAKALEWYLSDDDAWTQPYYAAGSTRAAERVFFVKTG